MKILSALYIIASSTALGYGLEQNGVKHPMLFGFVMVFSFGSLEIYLRRIADALEKRNKEEK